MPWRPKFLHFTGKASPAARGGARSGQAPLLGGKISKGILHALQPARGFDLLPDRVQKRPGLLPPVSYCAFTHVSDPTSLTDTSEKKIRSGWPSAVPRRSIERRRGPAFL
jgi:hypothetical protein